MRPHILYVILYLQTLCSAQSYQHVSTIEFASRIHYTSIAKPQQSRVAGSDYLISESNKPKTLLSLDKDIAFVIIQKNNYKLNKDQIEGLKVGRWIQITDRLDISLASDAQDRSKAMLLVRSSGRTTNKDIHTILNLTIKKPIKMQNKSQ